MTTGRRGPAPNAAVRAEPAGIGSSGARDPLAREVKLLGALLGQVIVEQAGVELFELLHSRGIQVRLLGHLRARAPDDPERERLLRLVQLTVNGVAAGLQSTG